MGRTAYQLERVFCNQPSQVFWLGLNICGSVADVNHATHHIGWCLAEGDSYWTLARLERQKGDTKQARAHAKLALEKPIVLQSEELEQAIHKFIDELK